MSNQTISAPPAVSSAKSLPVYTRWIPVPLIAADQALATRFLGDDLDEVCAAAVENGDPTFLVTAALPLARRKEALKSWRAKTSARIIASVPQARAFRNSAAPEVRAKLDTGEITLLELEHLICEADEASRNSRYAALIESKQRLSASILSALRDCNGSESGPIWPGAIIILETGETEIFRRRSAAVQYAREAGCRFILAEVGQDKVSIHPGSETA